MEEYLASYEMQIEYILEHFDWEKVHRTMTTLDWSWHHTDGVPKIGQLVRAARRHLEQVASDASKGCYSCSGGFWAYNADGLLRLLFVVAEWDGEGALEDSVSA